MPIARYLEWLERTGNLTTYLEKLTQAFNPAAVTGLMCRDTISVGWDGRLFDCDFNQMLDLPADGRGPQSVADLLTRRISSPTRWSRGHTVLGARGRGLELGGATTA